MCGAIALRGAKWARQRRRRRRVAQLREQQLRRRCRFPLLSFYEKLNHCPPPQSFKQLDQVPDPRPNFREEEKKKSKEEEKNGALIFRPSLLPLPNARGQDKKELNTLSRFSEEKGGGGDKKPSLGESIGPLTFRHTYRRGVP